MKFDVIFQFMKHLRLMMTFSFFYIEAFSIFMNCSMDAIRPPHPSSS